MDMNIIASRSEPKECINRVSLVGSVIHKFRPAPNVITLTVAVGNRNIPHAIDPNGANYPNVVFYGEDTAATIDNSIIVEDRKFPRVCIEGVIQTSRKDIPGERSRYFQDIVGDSIRLAATSMEAATGKSGIGSHKLEPKNEVCLMGEVTHIYTVPGDADSTRPKVVVLTLRVVTDGHTNYPHVTCFGPNVRQAMELEEGDGICVTGYMETRYRDRDGKRTRFESIVALEVAKTD